MSPLEADVRGLVPCLISSGDSYALGAIVTDTTPESKPTKPVKKAAPTVSAPPAFRANRMVCLKDAKGAEVFFQRGDEITIPFPSLAVEQRFLRRGDIGKLS